MPRGAMRVLFQPRPGERFIFLLRDDFPEDEAADLATPRPANPGPGIWDVVQPNSDLSIVGDDLVFETGVPSWSDGLFSQPIERAVGIALLSVISNAPTTGDAWGPAVWANDAALETTGTAEMFLRLNIGMPWFYETNNGDVRILFPDGPNAIALILRGVGGFVLCRYGSVWKLLFVQASGSIDTLYGEAVNDNADDGRLSTKRIGDLPANGYDPWATDYGIATERLTGVRSSGDTFSHRADCIIEDTITTLPPSGQKEIWFRIQDALNYWAVTVDSSGTIDLDEVVDGDITKRGSVTAAIVDGERIQIHADDEAIGVYANAGREFFYAGASNFKTKTSGELGSDGGGVVSDIVSWPRIIFGDAKAGLVQMEATYGRSNL